MLPECWISSQKWFPQYISRFPEHISWFPEHISRFPEHISRFPEYMSWFPEIVSRFPEYISQVPEYMSWFPKIVSRIWWPPLPLGVKNVKIQENSKKKSGDLRGALRDPLQPFLGP